MIKKKKRWQTPGVTCALLLKGVRGNFTPEKFSFVQQNPFCLLFLALNQFPHNNNKYSYFYKRKTNKSSLKREFKGLKSSKHMRSSY